MKKILLFLFATLCFQGTINAQYKTFRKNVYVKFKNYENVSTKLETTIDSINFKFEPDTENLWGIKITNNGNQKVSVLWNEAVFGAGNRQSKVIFGTDSELLMNSEKSPEMIYPGSIISREIDNIKNFSSSDYTEKLYRTKYLKDGVEWPVKLIVPIKKGNTQKDYTFDFLVYKQK